MQIDIPHIVQSISKEIQAICKDLGPQRFGFTLMSQNGVPKSVTNLHEHADQHVHRGRVFGDGSRNTASWNRVRDMQSKLVLEVLPRNTPYQMYVTVNQDRVEVRLKLGKLPGVKTFLNFPEFSPNAQLLNFINEGIKKVGDFRPSVAAFR